ncbi:MAG: lipopolysaccharide biosynthesis protein [Candidatus Eisenbacteria bacterium]|uniref:Lipopolysaccharide biosynthesis protein n=1 Tax=Eiseniibacteriota bacterium TaxID=2212470 RepID=A0A948RWS4_UNCEI|nr:lipopolysaccharide biosynthesis protein [Candidatus Eisenbacteria bacterium]MBU1948753.1 lipopolysaccharide biosynthesis protein [Candidatus Eisenbacteria bacterium]MBU2690462.1 lipopolysaccharide biosynthesis protein [Candidatus Eisenbacteria bacterium]
MKLRDLLKKLTQQGAVYGVGEMAGRAAGFLMIPIYTAVLITEDFGRLQVLFVMHQMGQMTADLGFMAAFMRWYGLAKTDEERKNTVVTISAGLLAATLLASGLLASLASPMAKLFLTSTIYTRYVQLVALSLGLRVLSTMANTYLRLRERPVLYAFFSLGRTLLSLALVLFFVLVQKQGIWGVLVGEAIANAAALIVAIFILLPELRGKFIPSYLVEFLNYGLPFVLVNLGAFALLSTDKLILSGKGLVSETGLYALGGKLGIALNVGIIWPFTLVWTPTMFSIAREETEEEAQRLFAKIFTYMAGLLLWAGLGLGLLAPEIIDLVSPPEYASAALVAPFLILSYVIYGFYRNFQVGLNILGKSRRLASSFLIAASLNLILNLILIPHYGMIGAAVATLISYTVMAGLVLQASQRHYPIPYEWWRVGKLILLTLGLYIAGRWLSPAPGYVLSQFVVKAALLLIFPIGVMTLGVLTPGERRRLVGRLRRSRAAKKREPGAEEE